MSNDIYDHYERVSIDDVPGLNNVLYGGVSALDEYEEEVDFLSGIDQDDFQEE